jgi:hypothetical protein
MAFRGIFRPAAAADRVFAWFAILPPLLFLAIALFSRMSLPHWSMSGFLFGFPLAGAWTARAVARYPRAIRAAWLACVAANPLLAVTAALQARDVMLSRIFPLVGKNYRMDWQLGAWSALTDAWPELGSPSAIVTRTWAQGAKAGHVLGPGVTIAPLIDPRHFQYLLADPPERAMAIHAANPDEIENALQTFGRQLQEGGYRATGEPRLIPQKTGDYLRFYLIAIPVERAD